MLDPEDRFSRDAAQIFLLSAALMLLIFCIMRSLASVTSGDTVVHSIVIVPVSSITVSSVGNSDVSTVTVSVGSEKPDTVAVCKNKRRNMF